MKKSLIITLALVFVLGIVGTAFAAANPFVDVPAKHWSYDAIQKLVSAGVVSGYGDNTFRGDRTLTRYEMAVTVAKAMANSEKASAENKAIIDKLAVEFQAELAGLNVRVTKLENKVGNIKFTGEVRERYERASATNGASWGTRVRLNMNAALTDDLSFVGRYEAANGFGNAATSNLTQAYVVGKAFGIDTVEFGRLPLFLGKGLIADISGSAAGTLDGAAVVFGNQVKVLLAGAKYSTGLGDANNVLAANVAYSFSKDFDMTASYLKDKTGNFYKTFAVGLGYTGIKDFTITAEYGDNKATIAKTKAGMAKIKYLGADGAKDKSYGVWLGYKKAGTAFDLLGLTTLDSAGGVSALTGIKGFEYGFEYTAFKNGIVTLQYNDSKGVKTGAKQRNVIAQLVYSF